MNPYYATTNIDFMNGISNYGAEEIRRLDAESITNPEQFSIEKYFIDYDDKEKNFLTLEWKDKLVAAGLEPYYALVFVRQNTEHNNADGPHVDAQPDGIFTALNYAHCLGEEKMVWYKANETVTDLSKVPVHDTLPYIQYEKSKVREVASAPTASRGSLMSLVRTDIPHDIIIKGNSRRLSVSLRFHNKFKDWEEAVEFFKGIKI